MGKDAKGHGSDPHGGAAHQEGIQQATAPMQRRQYEAIAGAINSFGQQHPDVHGDLAQHFAGALRGTNPKYDVGKFQKAAMTGDMGRTQNKDPGMTRSHYEAVANIVKGFGSTHPDGGALADHFATRLGAQNSNFNASRFKKAAGG